MTEADEQTRLRKQGLIARRSLSDAQRELGSSIITDRFERSTWFRSATTVAVYLPAWDEVDTTEIILRSWRANKSVVAPVIKKNSRMVFSPLEPDARVRTNAFGLFEPDTRHKVTLRDVDVVITPLAAFDSRGSRIGMGGGFFDRYFAGLGERQHYRRPRLVGVAFACQQTKKIPQNPWDIPLYACITENGAYTF